MPSTVWHNLGTEWDRAANRLRLRQGRTTIILVLWGAALFLSSDLIGIAHVCIVPVKESGGEIWVAAPSCDPSKNAGLREVGFWAALNWSVTSIIIWPAMFYTLRSMISAADRVFSDIDGSPMGWLKKGKTESIRSTWLAHKGLLRRLALLFVIAGVLESAAEWYSTSATSLLWNTAPAEYDWSAIRVGGSLTMWIGQAAFSLAAFVYQGVALAVMLTFVTATVMIARVMGLHGSGEREPPLLIDIESNDSSNRVGFERFMIIIDCMILFVALGFANFFLTRVQNAFLHDPSQSASVGAFVSRDFVLLDTKDIKGLFVLVSNDFSSIVVAVGAFIGLFLCFFFFNATLRHSAMEARNRSDHVLVKPQMLSRAKQSGLELADIRERLRNANVWPLGYSDLMPTLAFLTICLVTIIFFRIGIYLAFLWIAGWIVARSAAGLVTRK